mmetsp:Transcript_820/g.2477  ORF Transcript_820/g.2477 Transcript_820/m.2477 type:complete len:403 (+) Transcript_820:400-1608(+)
MSLTSVECLRACAILEEAVQKLTFLEAITPDVLQHRDELTKFVGDEISRIIREQRQLEQRYETLIAQRSALKGLANRSKYKFVQNKIQEVARALRDSTKNLCRNLKDNPNISGNLLKIQRERQELIGILETTVCEVRTSGSYIQFNLSSAQLRESGSFTALIQKVARDKGNQERVRRIILQERDVSDRARQLDKDLCQEKVGHKKQVAEQQTSIAQLKQQLQSIKTKASVDTKYFRKEAHARTCSVARIHRQEERFREIEIANLERHRDIERSVHHSTMEFLKMQQQHLANELTQWERKYQDDYNQLAVDYETLTQERVSNLERLTLLKKRRDLELETERAIKEHATKQDEIDRRRLIEANKKHGAALAIQSTVRTFLQRKAEDDARRAADKKKKKGGKKKK